MDDATPMPLAGSVPVVTLDAFTSDMHTATEEIRDQLIRWGFMAVEVPGIFQIVDALLVSFAEACASSSPSLGDYVHTIVPQVSIGGNHGYYPFYSEVPRLAHGVPDPKEHIHVSGAMLSNKPRGASAVLEAFPRFGASARSVFDFSFELVSLFAQVVHGMLPADAPPLDLSREASNLRVVHYRELGNRTILAHEHSGIQMLGLQLPPNDPGLQYILHDRTWVEPIIARSDVVLCNIGRMLTKASGDRFRPSTHRVHRSDDQAGYERMSSVLFAYPPYDSPQWIATEERVVTLNETWGDFIRNRFAGLGNPADE